MWCSGRPGIRCLPSRCITLNPKLYKKKILNLRNSLLLILRIHSYREGNHPRQYLGWSYRAVSGLRPHRNSINMPITKKSRGSISWFRGSINFTSELDDKLKIHIEKSTVFKGVSKVIKNNMLDCMLYVIRQNIKNEIQQSDVFL